MSLSGLTSTKVAEAYQAALAENGGWFLLRHATREKVELLAQGSRGVNEARSGIKKCTEKLPVYGLVHFRRKKVVLKYTPEKVSKFLQVRLRIQFQTFLNTFSPYDAIYSFTEASDLSEATIALVCKIPPSTNPDDPTLSVAAREPLRHISEDNEENASETTEVNTNVVGVTTLEEVERSISPEYQSSQTVIDDYKPNDARSVLNGPTASVIEFVPTIEKQSPNSTNSVNKSLPTTPKSTTPTHHSNTSKTSISTAISAQHSKEELHLQQPQSIPIQPESQPRQISTCDGHRPVHLFTTASRELHHNTQHARLVNVNPGRGLGLQQREPPRKEEMKRRMEPTTFDLSEKMARSSFSMRCVATPMLLDNSLDNLFTSRDRSLMELCMRAPVPTTFNTTMFLNHDRSDSDKGALNFVGQQVFHFVLVNWTQPSLALSGVQSLLAVWEADEYSQPRPQEYKVLFVDWKALKILNEGSEELFVDQCAEIVKGCLLWKHRQVERLACGPLSWVQVLEVLDA